MSPWRPVLAVACLALVGCTPARTPQVAPEVKVIRVFQEKLEIAEGLKRAADAFEQEHPGLKLEVETVGGGQDYDAALADRFQAGVLPDLFMSIGESNLDPWVDLAEDLSDQPWVSDLRPGTVEPVTRNGKIYGNPLAIEGYGFLYNKALFARAGISKLPDTLDGLEAACRKLQAAGIRPFSNGYAEWWVLGIHNFNLLLGSVGDLPGFLKALEARGGPGPEAAVVEGWMSLLDLTARYGPPDATQTGDYTTSVAAFLAGEAAMIQQGNWIEPDLARAAPGLDVGVLPMPVGNRPDDRLPMGVPNFWIVNKNSPVKAEAKAWLEWLHSSDRGKKLLLEELKVIPPYVSLGAEPVGPLSKPFAEAWQAGKTKPWIFPRYLGKTKFVAAAMRSYLDHPQSHREFWVSLTAAWSGNR